MTNTAALRLLTLPLLMGRMTVGHTVESHRLGDCGLGDLRSPHAQAPNARRQLITCGDKTTSPSIYSHPTYHPQGYGDKRKRLKFS